MRMVLAVSIHSTFVLCPAHLNTPTVTCTMYLIAILQITKDTALCTAYSASLFGNNILPFSAPEDNPGQCIILVQDTKDAASHTSHNAYFHAQHYSTAFRARCKSGWTDKHLAAQVIPF